MKDYRIKRTEQPDYILDAKPCTVVTCTEEGKREENDVLNVYFADGRVFRDVQYDAENVKKIAEQLEKQAKAGVANISVFENRRTKAGVMTGASIIGGPIIGVVTAATTAINPVGIAIGAGALTLGTLIPAAYSLVKNYGKVRELRKIKYRDEHRADLQSYPKYANALAGLSTRQRNLFEAAVEEGIDPFSIAGIDEYRQTDLEQIVKNINTEKTYQFTYTRTPAAAKK